MTKRQIDQIRTMRMQGIGYKAIASAVGTSRDAVRNYCKRHMLMGAGFVLVLNLDEQRELGNVCLNCGDIIMQPQQGRHRKFCSDACRRKWWNEHAEQHRRNDKLRQERQCQHCGRSFSYYGTHIRKYCSHECYVQHRFGKEEDL